MTAIIIPFFLLILQFIKIKTSHIPFPWPLQCSFHAFKQAVNPTISTLSFTELLLHDFKKSSRFFIPEFKFSFISSSIENDRTFHLFSSFCSSLANNLFLFSLVMISALVSFAFLLLGSLEFFFGLIAWVTMTLEETDSNEFP